MNTTGIRADLILPALPQIVSDAQNFQHFIGDVDFDCFEDIVWWVQDLVNIFVITINLTIFNETFLTSLYVW